MAFRSFPGDEPVEMCTENAEEVFVSKVRKPWNDKISCSHWGRCGGNMVQGYAAAPLKYQCHGKRDSSPVMARAGKEIFQQRTVSDTYRRRQEAAVPFLVPVQIIPVIVEQVLQIRIQVMGMKILPKAAGGI